MAGAALLSVRGLKSHYHAAQGVVRAVDGVTLEVRAGEVVGVVGESGSGKSTLALSLMGLLDPPGRVAEGVIDFEGRDLRGLNERQWRAVRGRRIGMIFQSPEASFSPNATIGRQITQALRTHRLLSAAAARDAAQQALTMVGMPRPREILDSYPFELSGGMCQRAALALALSLEPALLLADEPTASLDLLAQAEMTRLFGELRRRLQLTMLIISHDLGLIGRLADRVVIMYAGRVVESGPTEQVLRSPRHPYTRGLLASLPRLEAEPRPIPSLTGHAPDMTALPAGCAFAPRCAAADERCRRQAPPLENAGTRHEVACWWSMAGAPDLAQASASVEIK